MPVSDELKQHLREQRRFLETSSAAFDAGDRGEAARLATTVRVLVHDTGRMTSLLTHLGRKDAVRFYATPYPPVPRGPGLGWSHLIRMRLQTGEGGGTFPIPKLDNFPPGMTWGLLEFSPWWDEEVVSDEFQGRPLVLRRRDIVLVLADKEGGAHVDDPATLPADYAALARTGLGLESQARPLLAQERVCMRQIAHEVAKTIDEELADLLA